MQNNLHQVVCFGEILWDILPAGAEAGGAPMNVAYHLQQLGKNPAMISRVGNDEAGRELIGHFAAKGVCIDYIQVDKNHETGKVYAIPGAGHEMTYDIVQPVAWDFIEYQEELATLVASAAYFVFGSLACRNEVSRGTLFRLLEHANTCVFDINLRAPHYSKTLIESLLYKTDLLKLNLQELEIISAWFTTHHRLNDQVNAIRDRFNIPSIVITMGEKGAESFAGDTHCRMPAERVEVVDTVGSGDACLAGILAGLLEKKPWQQALEKGCRLGAWVATQKGACPTYMAI